MRSTSDPPRFNLWSKPWIMVETPQGEMDVLGVRQLLRNAGTYRALYEPSPLVVVGVHRLLVAILQDIIRPRDEYDLVDLWEADAFPQEKIEAFGEQYAHRFDLFSADTPFLQSADIPLHPEKRGKGKSVGYLFQEQTAGSAVTHYNHTYEDEQLFCAVCLGKGLLTLPAFASSGGRGMKPSINGVPPIYVIPGGDTYYHSLVASLVTPYYQPKVADRENDTPWWRHDPMVARKNELLQVGYLHSLTFPARRVRLHPQRMERPCTRCGQTTAWGAAEMVYKMGESRPKKADLWRDPFAAYRLRKKKDPVPIRPVAGRAVWREFSGLFLPQERDEKSPTLRPAIIGQLEEEMVREALPYDETTPIPFRAVGLRTNMKMKIFEWESNGFLVPPKVLADPLTGQRINDGIDFAAQCDRIIKYTFRQYFGGDSQSERHKNLRLRLSQTYWERLAPDFQEFVLGLGAASEPEAPFHAWLDTAQTTAINQFDAFARLVGDDAAALKQRVQAVNHNRAKIFKLRKETHPQEVNA